MYCPKCGKEIENDSKFCAGCGSSTEQTAPAAEPAPVADIPLVSGRKQKVKFKDLPPNEKKKRAIIGAVCFVIALILIFGSSGSNQNVISVESGSSDYGSVAFNYTLDEYIEAYNACIDEDEEYESVREMRYLNKSSFTAENVSSPSGEKSVIYAKNFGNNYGTLGTLYITVDGSNGKIQMIQWTCYFSDAKYSTDDAYLNYTLKLPASFFAIADEDVDFPYDGDYESYHELINEIGEEMILEKGDCFYYGEASSNNIMTVTLCAATDDSAFFEHIEEKLG